MLLSVVFSFRNEEKVLEELISTTASVLSGADIDFELIFVNDNSDDNSLEILKSHRAKDERIKIVNMSRRFGVSPCVMAGMRFAKGDAVVYLDADLQDPPEVIPKMVALFNNGADVVHTVRTERSGESAGKMWITSWAYKVINRISDISLPEDAGDFKLISRRVVAELIKLNEYQPYTRGLIPWVGFRQETIEYKRNSRFAGETKFPLFQSRGPLNEFVKGITSFSEIPLYLSLFIGFSVSALSFLYLIVVLFKKLNGWNLPGWTAIMGVTLLLGGIILFTNGVIGIYIGRIYNNVKGRPAYIIDDTIGFEESPPDDNGRQQS